MLAVVLMTSTAIPAIASERTSPADDVARLIDAVAPDAGDVVASVRAGALWQANAGPATVEAPSTRAIPARGIRCSLGPGCS